MNKYKVYVYAICKNESKFIDRWVKSMKEADGIYVLDTGSTDKSIELLKKLGVEVVFKEIKPWRFDVARNESLKLVPKDADICVCTDIDEVFEAGWREKMEEAWSKGADKLRYNYNWSFDVCGNPATTFYISKVHKRNGYKWLYPVHEVLNKIDNEREVLADGVTLNHYADSTKSRSSYLPLLELSVKEDPTSDRNMHYLGREYMYYGMYEKSIDTLIKHLDLKSATWKPERCASMRFIARDYLALGRMREAIMWLKCAISEEPTLRESYVELAKIYTDNKEYEQAYNLLKRAFLIKNKPLIYINEAFAWNEYIYELAIVTYNLGKYPESLSYINEAIKINPKEKRLKTNKKIINKALNG